MSKVAGHIAHQQSNYSSNRKSTLRLHDSRAKFRFVFIRCPCLACNAGKVLAAGWYAKPLVKLLILDNDLGFQFWLAKSLEPFGYSVIPADTVSRAKGLLRQLKLSLDLLMVNPEVPGAAEFTASLRRQQPLLKIVALVPKQGKESTLSDLHPDARHAKPDQSVIERPAEESSAESDWARFVQEVTGRRTTGGRAN